MYPFQTIPPDDFTLSPNIIDIWQCPLDKDLQEHLWLLSTHELERAYRFKFERHKRRFIAARVYLRSLLGKYLNLSPKDIIIQCKEQGKPFTAHTKAIEFNLSHSKDLALIAIGQKEPLGIDLEFFSKRPYLGISKILFSEEECRILEKTPKEARCIRFFHIWAQKEAFIKASGLGLSYPTKTFTVGTQMTGAPSVYDEVHQKTWLLQSFMPQIACSAALCFRGDIVDTLRFKQLEVPPISD